MRLKKGEETKETHPDEEMSLWFVASSDTEDRVGDVVVPKGGKVPEGKTVPFLTFHEGKMLPIGKIVEHEVSDGEFKVKVKFDKEDELAQEVFRKYKEGFLDAVSIGFDPVPEKTVEREDGRFRFNEWKLLEVSAVNIPANPDALIDEGRSATQQVIKMAKDIIERFDGCDVDKSDGEDADQNKEDNEDSPVDDRDNQTPEEKTIQLLREIKESVGEIEKQTKEWNVSELKSEKTEQDEQTETESQDSQQDSSEESGEKTSSGDGVIKITNTEAV